jgi:uroporphyrinogen-III synthase
MTEPLAGRRIVNTRAPHQAADLDSLLVEYGAVPVSYPCIDIDSPADPVLLDVALRKIAQGYFDWLVLTSRNTVYALAKRFQVLDMDISVLSDLRVAVVGPATAELARQMLGVTVTATPDEYIAEALAAVLSALPGARVFLPQSDLARPVLQENLSAAGMKVTAVPAYRTVIGSGGDDVPALLAQHQIDAVVFTSSSTAENFMQRLKVKSAHPVTLDNVVVACIGPVTAETVQSLGLDVHVIPDTYTLEGLVHKLADYMRK